MTIEVVNRRLSFEFSQDQRLRLVYIGRGSVWGNPFPMKNKSMSERLRVIDEFEDYLLESPHLLSKLPSLSSKVLSCFCAPLPCHGHVLAHYSESLISTGRLPVSPVVFPKAPW